ncbi:hypothetical protein ACS0TY_012249 [Phlomoides rotata]
MEIENARRSQKRKLSQISEEESSRFPLNELNQDLLERVLSWLPTSSFFRLTSVCKRWKSAADSTTFKIACSQVPSRDPWFFMVDSHPESTHHPIVFDSSEGNWKKLNHPPLIPQDSCSESIPVAASGGLLCFLRRDSGFTITNPVTAASRQLNSPSPDSQQPIPAIAMASSGESFKLVLISGELPNLKFRQYNSATDQWGDEIGLTRKPNTAVESETNDDCAQYFLSKSGDVVSTEIQRSPSKQYSSILCYENGEEVIYFLSSFGTVVSCNLTRRNFFEFPRLLPVFSEYSIDLIECEGRMYVVLLSEFLESASVRVWKWDEIDQFWKQIAAMPPFMSHKFYGKKVDINCTGAGKKMMVCVNSGEICSYLMCDLIESEWVELGSSEDRDFVCAFSFEPRIEAAIWGRTGN